MSKLAQIKKAMETASDNDATRAIKYLLWQIESLEEQSKLERLLSLDSKGRTSNHAEQLAFERRRVDEGRSTIEDYRLMAENFRKNS